jgi:RsiW-degrading membrane proteinase PrsW (M82 family)
MLLFLLEVFISGDNTLDIFMRKFRKVLETPFLFLGIGVLVGIFSYLVTTGLQHYSVLLEYGLVHKVSFFIVVGMLEEYIKHLMVRFADEEKIHSVDDAIAFSIIVAFGFAFVENIMYFKNFADNFQNSWGFLATFLVLRSIISVGAHVCFSAIVGYFYGIASFAREITRDEIFRIRHTVLRRLQAVLHVKLSTVFHEEKMMEGLLIAMGLHAVFNILLQLNLLVVTVIYLLLLFAFVLSRFHRLAYHRQENNLEEPAITTKQERFDSLIITPLERIQTK